jgi:hypothetical protein
MSANSAGVFQVKGDCVVSRFHYTQAECLVTTIRVATRKRFTQIERETANDTRLSFRARGVLLWLLDKPDDWRTSSDAIARHGKEGRDAVRAALTELEDAGYLLREKIRGEHGQWVTVVTVYESSTKPQVIPETCFQASVDQSSARQASVFQASSSQTDTDTDTRRKLQNDGLSRIPPPTPGCEKCEGGQIFVDDNSVIPCECQSA